jgi:hypothetical protein
MNPLDFDALILNNQGFNTLDTLAQSNNVQSMTQTTLQSIQAMQTPVPQGHIPQHVVLPIFQKQEAATPAAGMSQNQPQFFAIVNGSQKGPFTLEQLKGLAIADVINSESLVWMQGLPEWVDLKTCLSNLKM